MTDLTPSPFIASSFPTVDLAKEYGPDSELSEPRAFKAFNLLKALPQSTPDNPVRNYLRRYAADRSSKGLKLFPTENAKANNKRLQYSRDLYLKDPADLLTGDQLSAYQADLAEMPDPEDYRARQTNRAYFNLIAPSPIAPDRYDLVRDEYARTVLKLEDTSDKAVFRAIQGQFQEEASAFESLKLLAKDAYDKGLGGETMSAAERWKATASLPAKHKQNAREVLARQNQEAQDTRRRLMPTVKFLATSMLSRRGMDVPRELASPEASATSREWLRALGELNPPDRAAALFILSQEMEKLDTADDSAGTFKRSATNASKTALQLLESAFTMIDSETSEGFLDEEDQWTIDADERARLTAALQGIESIPENFRPDDSALQKAFIAGSGQAAIFGSLFTGAAGLTFLGTSMAGQSYAGQRLESPEADPAIQFGAAALSGTAQAATEIGMTKLGLKMIGGRLPGLATLFTKARITAPAARSLAAFPLAAAGASAVEFTEEIVQDATDSLLSDIANQLSGIDPATDWGEFLTRWTTKNRTTEEVFYAIVPFALIGSGAVASFRHFKHGAYLQQATPIMRQMGFRSDKIQEIREASPEAAAEIVRQEIKHVEQKAEERAQAAAATQPASKIAEEGNNRAAKQFDLFHAGDQSLTLETISVDSRKTRQGKSGSYGGLYTFDNQTEADNWNSGLEGKEVFGIKLKDGVKIEQYDKQIERLDQTELENLRAQGIKVISGKSLLRKKEVVIIDKTAIASFEPLSKLQSDNSFETSQDESQRSAVLESFRAAAELSRTAGFPIIVTERNDFTEQEQFVLRLPDQETQYFDEEEQAIEAWQDFLIQQQNEVSDEVIRAANTDLISFLTEEVQLAAGTKVVERDVEMDASRAVKEGLATMEQIKARAQIFALQEGSSTAPDFAIMARRWSEVTSRGIYRATVEYYRGADPLNILEDLAETNIDKGLTMGMLDGADLVSEIRTLEEATGNAYIADDYTYAETNKMPLLEAMSKAGVEYFLGNIKNESLPSTIRRWFQQILAVAGAAFNHARTLARSAPLMKAIKEGRVNQKFVDLIADSVGLNEANTEARYRAAEQQAQEQALNSDLEEIADVLRGRLPHPDSMKGNPMASELRVIHDGMVKVGKRRNKKGQRLLNTRQADNFFLPKGEVVSIDGIREELNERGFDFDTEADMLAALDDSLYRNLKTYAVGTLEQETSYSVAKFSSPDYRRQTYEQRGVLNEETQQYLAEEQDLFAWAGRAGKQLAPQRDGTPLQNLFARYFADPSAGENRTALAQDLMSAIPEGSFAQQVLPDLFTHEKEWNPVGLKLETTADIFAANAALRNPFFETLRVLVLDEQNVVQHAEIVSMGSINQTVASSDLFMRVLANANRGRETELKRVVMSHNHPSGDVAPSSADKSTTPIWEAALESIGAVLVDHVITNGRKGYSFFNAAEFEMGPEFEVDWTVKPRQTFQAINSSDAVREISKPFRAVNSAANLAFLANSAGRVTAMIHLPSNRQEALKLMSRAFAESGGNLVFLSLGANSKISEGSKWEQELRALNFKLMDVIAADGRSMAEEGLSMRNMIDGTTFSISPAQDRAYLDAVAKGDMETAQKMVDEAARWAGYEIKAYHGTHQNKTFLIFDTTGRIPGQSASFFTPSKTQAEKFADPRAPKVLAVYLDSKNLAEVNFNGERYSPEQVAKAIQDNPQGVILKNVTERGETNDQFAITDPSQIKSADPVTYDENGNVIPLSKRFDKTRPDITFSIGRTKITPTAQTRTFPTANGGLIGPATFSIRAFHGTPYKVNRFSTDKIGTGEGAQAFGYGLYMAGNPEVADGYRKRLSQIGGTGDIAVAERLLEGVGNDIDAALREIESRRKFSNMPDSQAKWDRITEIIQTRSGLSNLYTVSLNVEEDQLLDWDKPLNEQPLSVQLAAKNHFKKAGFNIAPAMEMTGGEFYGYLQSYYQTGEDVGTSAKDSSLHLSLAGIRGIRYLDGNSRSAGEGFYNYVIFDDADITILEENGQPVALAQRFDETRPEITFSIGQGPTLKQEIEAIPKVKYRKYSSGLIKIKGKNYRPKDLIPNSQRLSIAVQEAEKALLGDDPVSAGWHFGNIFNNYSGRGEESSSWEKDEKNRQIWKFFAEKGRRKAKEVELKEKEFWENLFGKSADELVEIIHDTITPYYWKYGVGAEQIVYRKENSPPEVVTIEDSGLGDASRISKSTYPLIKINLSNGSAIFEKIRISDHGQVSSNAPRTYEYDYRARNLKEAIADGELGDDMNRLAASIWEEQKNALAQSAIAESNMQSREGAGSGLESRQSLAQTEQQKAGDNATTFSISRRGFIPETLPPRQQTDIFSALVDEQMSMEEFEQTRDAEIAAQKSWLANIPDDRPLIWRAPNLPYVVSLTPNVSGENGPGWRVTLWDRRGPLSHSERATRYEAAFEEGRLEYATEFLEDLPAFQSSFSLSPRGIQRLERAIIDKLSKGPEERADYASRLIDRLDGLRRKIAEKGQLSEADRIAENIREASAIFTALPIEARTRASFPIKAIIDAQTERGRLTVLEKMIDSADKALETYLKKQYLDQFEKLFDLAKPDLLPSKSLRTRLVPEQQRLASQAFDASIMEPAEVMKGIVASEALIAKANATLNDLYANKGNADDIAREEQAIRDAELAVEMLETYGALAKQSAAEIAQAYKHLKNIYSKGRQQREFLDAGRREELAAMRADILQSLGGPTDALEWAKNTASEGFKQRLDAFRFSSLSFHQIMEELFPNSPTARQFQDRIRAAERETAQARIETRERFQAFLTDRWGPGKLKHNKILAQLSQRREWMRKTTKGDLPLEIRETTKTKREKLLPEQARAILAGTLKPGWENDPIAMQSLRDALADYDLKRLRDKSRAEFVYFDRTIARSPRKKVFMSDLEAVYLLQLAAQQQYLPALDRYGYTAQVIEQIRETLADPARDVRDFLTTEYAGEYARLNEVYRSLYFMDMPQIRNYAPGKFEHSIFTTEPTPDGTEGAQVNAMSAGFTKTREHHTARPQQVNALDVFWNHTEATNYFIGWAETIRDMNATFKTPEVRRALEARFGKEIASDFYKWIDQLTTDGRSNATESSAMRRILNNAQASLSAIGLAFNVGSLLKQISAGTGALMEMPTKAAVKGLYLAIQNPSSFKHLWQNERIQQRIKMGMSPEDRAILDAANAKPSTIMAILEAGRAPLGWTDALFTTLSAMVAYNYHLDQALKSGLSETAAEEFAIGVMDRVIIRTAQPATTQDKSLIENTTQGLGKFLLIFRSDPRQKIGLALEAVRRYRTGKMTKQELGRRFFWGWMMYGILAQLATDVWHTMSREDDDDDDWSLDNYLFAATAGPLSGLPLFGAIIETGIRGVMNAAGADLQIFANSTNPLDKAADGILRNRFIGALNDDQDDTAADLINNALRDTRDWAQIIGSFNKAAAIVPVTLRVVKDVTGIIDNILPDTQTEQDLEIIAELSKTAEESRDTRTERLDALVSEIRDLEPEAQEARLEDLDKNLARSVRRQLSTAQMTRVEKALKRLPNEQRATAIGAMMKERSPEQRATFRRRLEQLGILTPTVAEFLN